MRIECITIFALFTFPSAYLTGICSSDDACAAAVPHAVCRNNTCICKHNYEQTKQGQCTLRRGIATNVRLTHGNETDLKPYEGLVEVEVNGKWGPLLRHAIDDVTTKTICRMLGYGTVGFLVQRFQYPGTPLLNKLQCFGSETSISECIQEPSHLRSVFYDSPGIHCFDHVFTDVRLIGGTSPNSGSVQVKMDGRWGRVCDYNSIAGVMKAPKIDRVICRTLGYEMNDPVPRRLDPRDGTQLSWIDFDMTICNGTETNFNQCEFRPVTIYQPGCYATRGLECITNLNGTCTSDDICAAVPHAVCINKTCVCNHNYKQTKQGQCTIRPGIATNVRLTHGNEPDLKPYEGIVEVQVNGTWGPLLRHAIDDVTTKTICRMLGYRNVGFLIQRFQYPGTPLLNKLKCFGSETSISECIQEPSHFRSVFYDSPGIHCFDHVFTDVRLIGGSSPNNGSVQVKMDGRWGRVCDYNSIFGVMKAPQIDRVICRTLGYEMNDPVPRRLDPRDGTQLSWVDFDMTICNGTETNFNQCEFRPVTIYQPGCYATRGLECITNLDGACTSNDICAAVPNAVCRHKKCVCKGGHKQTNEGKCVPRESHEDDSFKKMCHVYQWKRTKGFGHIALDIDGGSYISFWPSEHIKPTFRAITGVPGKRFASLQEETEANGHPDMTFDLPDLNTEKIEIWWKGFTEDDPEWSLLLKNCSDIVYKALCEGSDEFIGKVEGIVTTPQAVVKLVHHHLKHEKARIKLGYKCK